MMPFLKTEKESIRLASKGDIPALKNMWKTCFGDEEEAVHAFFAGAYRDNQTTLVYFTQEKPAAMLSMIPAVFNSPLGQCKGTYVYAVATLPAYRGKGYMRKLEQECCRLTHEAGKSFCLLVPAEAPLFEMYGKLGYGVFSSVQTVSIEQKASLPFKETLILPCDFETFYRLRHKYLGDFLSAVRFEKEYQLYAYHEYIRSGGYIFSVDKGYICAYAQEETLYITESSLGISQIEQVIPALLRHTAKQKIKIRQPGTEPFSMIKWLDTDLAGVSLPSDTCNHYFGFALE